MLTLNLQINPEFPIPAEKQTFSLWISEFRKKLIVTCKYLIIYPKLQCSQLKIQDLLDIYNLTNKVINRYLTRVIENVQL